MQTDRVAQRVLERSRYFCRDVALADHLAYARLDLVHHAPSPPITLIYDSTERIPLVVGARGSRMISWARQARLARPMRRGRPCCTGSRVASDAWVVAYRATAGMR